MAVTANVRAKVLPFARFKDAIVNVLTGQGGSGDAGAHNQVAPVQISKLEAATLYDSYWLARKVVDIPVEDMLKNGRNITNLTDEELKRYNEAWKALKVNEVIATGLKWSRIFGGAAIIPVNNDMNLADPHKPSNFTNGRLHRLVAVDATMLPPSEGAGYELDITSPYYDMPKAFQHAGTSIDVSNLVICKGAQTTKHEILDTMNVARFWGISIYKYGKEAIVNATAALENAASMIASNNVDYLKVPQLYDLITQCADPTELQNIEQAFLARVSQMSRHKSMYNTAVIDESESIERLKYDFTGIPQIIHEELTAVSGAYDIPLTRLTGIAPAGLNSTGQGDLNNYNSNIVAQAETKLCPVYDAIDYYMTLHVFGKAREIEYTVNSPEVKTDKDKADVNKTNSEWINAISTMLPDSLVLKILQRHVVPEIPDAYIKEVEAEEAVEPVQSDDDDDDDDGDLDDTQELDSTQDPEIDNDGTQDN